MVDVTKNEYEYHVHLDLVGNGASQDQAIQKMREERAKAIRDKGALQWKTFDSCQCQVSIKCPPLHITY